MADWQTYYEVLQLVPDRDKARALGLADDAPCRSIRIGRFQTFDDAVKSLERIPQPWAVYECKPLYRTRPDCKKADGS